MIHRVAVGFFALMIALSFAPIESSARGGGGFGGGRGAAPHGGFRGGPLVRPPIFKAPFARYRHRRPGSVAVLGYPWDPWYGSGDYYEPSPQAVAPEKSAYPTDRSNEKPRHLGCVTQTYEVPAEGGGTASVNVVRC
jgi:hypothetical protein